MNIHELLSATCPGMPAAEADKQLCPAQRLPLTTLQSLGLGMPFAQHSGYQLWPVSLAGGGMAVRPPCSASDLVTGGLLDDTAVLLTVATLSCY